MKVLSIVGARPQFVKLAPIAAALAGGGPRARHRPHRPALRRHMSDVFFADLGIPAPDVHLGVGSGSHGVQTGAMLAAIDAVLERARPDWVLVYGDTNSTLAGALSAVKLHLPLAHLEAGLRSFNRRMPEEHNRVLTDHAADLLLAPTEVAMGHLADEGLAARSVLVGDVMTDVCFRVRDAVLAGPSAARRCPPGSTPAALPASRRIHRAENTDDPERLRAHRRGPRRPRRSPVAAAGPPAPRGPGRREYGIELAPGRAAHGRPAALPASWSRAVHRAPRASSPTPAACRRRRSCSARRAPRCAPRPSGSRPSSTAGTSSTPTSRRSPPSRTGTPPPRRRGRRTATARPPWPRSPPSPST